MIVIASYEAMKIAIANNLLDKTEGSFNERATFELARYAGGHGFDVKVISRGTTPLYRKFHRDNFKAVELPSAPGWQPHKQSGWWMKNLFRPFRPKIYKQFTKVITQHQAKLFHGLVIPEPHKIWRALHAMEIPIIQTVTSMKWHHHKQRGRIWEHSGKVDYVIFTSEQLKNDMMSIGYFRNVKQAFVIDYRLIDDKDKQEGIFKQHTDLYNEILK